MKLFPYKQVYMDIVESIAISLDVDVAVFNGEYHLFVCSPKYQQRKGTGAHVPSLQDAMRSEEPIIYRPGEMAVCEGCRFKENCPSTIEILHSIQSDLGPLGVVSILSFTEQGKKRMEENLTKYLTALEHIAKLLSNIMAYGEKDSPRVSPADEKFAIPEGDGRAIQNIHGKSAAMENLRQDIKKVSKSPSTVLIMAESGTGKELVARAIHDLSPRREKPFIAVNCASISESLFESEFFGYEGGSFTGARKNGKLGFFELAHTGTLFLDEISEMSLNFQAKLLRVLQENVIYRVGGTSPVYCDVRIIAATNCNLLELVEKKQFRHDLYFRLHVVPLSIPPLRERREDIAQLCTHFIAQFNEKLEKSFHCVSDDVLNLFRAYHWPGNVRELENMMEYLMNMEEGDEITDCYLPASIRQGNKEDGGALLQTLEKQTMLDLLNQFGWDAQGKKAVADKLGIGIRTLYRKLSQYQLEKQPRP